MTLRTLFEHTPKARFSFEGQVADGRGMACSGGRRNDIPCSLRPDAEARALASSRAIDFIQELKAARCLDTTFLTSTTETIMIVDGWRKLPVSLTELCINTTLRCGQSFR
jgi:hypothetical protein